jgi:Bacterial archaeo-eukaryotic release factor family 2
VTGRPPFQTPEPGIQRLFEADGPFLSLYLRTPGAVEDASQELATRWQSVRRHCAGEGVEEKILDTVDPLVEGAYERGPALAVIAGLDGVLLTESLGRELPRDAVVSYGPLPHLVPLLAESQRQVSSVVVLTDRTGAQLAVRSPGEGDRTATVEGTRSPHLTRSAPGGWSQPRYQRRAERLWKVNTAEVAEELTKVIDQVAPRFVAVAGDVRAVQLLVDQLPERAATLVHKIGGEFQDLGPALERADETAAELAAEDAGRVLARFAEERGQHDRAADGVEATVTALTKAQVATLLLNPETTAGRVAYFGDQPEHVALDRDTLVSMGAITPVEARLTDVLVRATVGTGAGVWLAEPGEDGPSEGVGALLRWPDQGAADGQPMT